MQTLSLTEWKKQRKCKGLRIRAALSWDCGVKLCTADEGDYLLAKSYGTSTFSVKGDTRSKYGALYIHFKSKCLKEYAHQEHDAFYKEFPLFLVTINEAALKKFSDYEKSQLEEFGITM